jgi:hypothetical protein
MDGWMDSWIHGSRTLRKPYKEEYKAGKQLRS